MKWLGGFADYIAWIDHAERRDARVFDDVIIAMTGEADAHRVIDAERRLQEMRNARHS